MPSWWPALHVEPNTIRRPIGNRSQGRTDVPILSGRVSIVVEVDGRTDHPDSWWRDRCSSGNSAGGTSAQSSALVASALAEQPERWDRPRKDGHEPDGALTQGLAVVRWLEDH